MYSKLTDIARIRREEMEKYPYFSEKVSDSTQPMVEDGCMTPTESAAVDLDSVVNEQIEQIHSAYLRSIGLGNTKQAKLPEIREKEKDEVERMLYEIHKSKASQCDIQRSEEEHKKDKYL